MEPRKAPFFYSSDRLGLFQTRKRQGTRIDIRKTLESVSNYEELVLEHPDCAARCRIVALDYFRYRDKGNHRSVPPNTIWIFGPTGSGKSRLARSFAERVAGDNYFFHPPGSLKWWDGYEGQSCVIIDDFRRRHCRDIGGLSYMLRILDRYDCQIEVKGGTRRCDWQYVIITCPRNPVEEFTYTDANSEDVVDEDIGQLVRRLTHIIELRILNGMVQEIDHTDRLRERYIVTDKIQPLQKSQILGVQLIQQAEPEPNPSI